MRRQPPRARPLAIALFLLLMAVVAALLAAPGVSRADVPDAADEVVATVRVPAAADIQWIADNGFDIWYVDPATRDATVALDSAGWALLEARGYALEIDEEMTASLNAAQPFPFYGGYLTIEEIYALYDSLATQYPALVQVVDYGDSWQKMTPGGSDGYDLKILRLTNRDIAGTTPAPGLPYRPDIVITKPVFFFMADIHAREITTPEMTRRFTLELLQGYGTNADATWLLDHHELWVAFTVNPDGYKIVENPGGNPLSHRKNHNTTLGTCAVPSTSNSQYGVDLNRNADFKWGGAGTSTAPCNLTYRGPSAASEPETQAFQNLMLGLFNDQRGPNDSDPAPADTVGIMLTLHTYGNLVLYPWGWTSAATPNGTQLQQLGRKLASYNGYTYGQPPNVLYAVSGSTDDYAYGKLGIGAFTFEIGPNSGTCGGFLPPFTCQDNFYNLNRAAFLYTAKVAREPYRAPFGPDALNLAPIVAAPGETVTVTATINDASTGNQPIAAASFWVGDPDWVAGADAQPMVAVDGSFNSPVEAVSGTLDTTGLPEGRHLVYVRGQDSGGNWGPASALFLDIEGTGPTPTPTATVPPATPTPTVTVPPASSTLYLPLIMR